MSGGNVTNAIELFTGSKVDRGEGVLPRLVFDGDRSACFLLDCTDMSHVQVRVDISTWKHGQILRRPGGVEQCMVPIDHELPVPFDAVQYTSEDGGMTEYPCHEARSFEFILEDGTRGVYEDDTPEGVEAIDLVYDQVVEQVVEQVALGSAFIYPLLHLDSQSRASDHWGCMFGPKLTVVLWTDEAGESG